MPASSTARPGIRPARAPVGVPRRPRVPRAHDSLRDISHRLEPRDYVLAHLLHEHRYLTTAQIAAVLFTAPRTCRNRLDALRRLGFIDWFMPARPGPGRMPVHWISGPLSARYVALHHDQRPPTPKAVREAQDALVSGGHLLHTDGVNQFFIDLLIHARQHADSRLARWWASRRIAAAINHNVRPDGHGVWTETVDGQQRQVAFFLEYDTGSCTHAVLTRKLAAYSRLAAAGGPRWPVLFWLPGAARETHFHRRLNGAARGLIVATAARADAAAAGHGPAGPVWTVAGNGRRRLRLSDLPARNGQAGAYHPGPALADQDPLHLLNDDRDPGAAE